MSSLKVTEGTEVNQPSLFKQLHSLASTVTKETKRLNAQILIPAGQHPELYEPAATKLSREVTSMKKECEDLKEKCRSSDEFGSFVQETHGLLLEKMRHTESIEAYLKQYGYAVPSSSTDSKQATDAAAGDPEDVPTEAEKQHADPTVLWELSPELEGDYSSRMTGSRLLPDNSGAGHGVRRIPGDSTDVFVRPLTPPCRPTAPRAGVALFQIPTVTLEKPEDDGSSLRCAGNERNEMEEPETAYTSSSRDTELQINSMREQQHQTFSDHLISSSNEIYSKASTNNSNPSNNRSSVHQSIGMRRRVTTANALTFHGGVATTGVARKSPFKSPRQLQQTRCALKSPLASPGAYYVTPSTKKNVEHWLSKHEPNIASPYSPTPLRGRLPHRLANNPLLVNCDVKTAVAPRMRIMVSSDISHKNLERKPASDVYKNQGTSCQSSGEQQHSDVSPTAGAHRAPTKDSSAADNHKNKISDDLAAVNNCFVTDRNINLTVNNKQSHPDLNLSLEEPDLSECTVNMLAEIRKRKEEELLRQSTAQLHAATSVASIISSLPSDSLYQSTNEQINSEKVPPARSNCIKTEPVESSLPDNNCKSEDVQNNVEQLSLKFKSTRLDTPEEPVLSRIYISKQKCDIDTPEEPVFSTDYMKIKEDDLYMNKRHVCTPEEPVLYTDSVKKSSNYIDTPEEPVMTSNYGNPERYVAFKIKEELPLEGYHAQQSSALSENIHNNNRSEQSSVDNQDHKNSVHCNMSLDDLDKSPEMSDDTKQMLFHRKVNKPQCRVTTTLDKSPVKSILGSKQSLIKLQNQNASLDKYPEMTDKTEQFFIRNNNLQATEFIKPNLLTFHSRQEGKYSSRKENEDPHATSLHSHSSDERSHSNSYDSDASLKQYANLNNYKPLSSTINKTSEDDKESEFDKQERSFLYNPSRSISQPKPSFDNNASAAAQHDGSLMDQTKLNIRNDDSSNRLSIFDNNTSGRSICDNTSKRSICDNSFSVAMLQYSHVPASPMPARMLPPE